MTARSGSFLGLEYLDTINTKVFSEMLFGGGSCRVETGQLVCIAGQLTGFCMVRSFAKGNFRTDCLFGNVFWWRLLSCEGQTIGLCCSSVDWCLYDKGFYRVFSQADFLILISFIYLNCHWAFTMFLLILQIFVDCYFGGVYFYYYHHLFCYYYYYYIIIIIIIIIIIVSVTYH